MKKNLFLSAAALAGAMTMVSCSSEDEMKPQNGKREEVKTSFTLSVGSVKPGTRMTANAVQQGQLFNGMEKIQLFPFINNGAVDGDEAITVAPIHLADFTTFEKDQLKAKIYNDVTIPVGVNNFVFYGMSQVAGNVDGELAASYDSKSLTSASTLASDVYFDLVSWNPGKTYNNFNLSSDAKATRVLNAINTVNSELLEQIATIQDENDITRRQLVAIQTTLTQMTAGSSNSVRLFMQDVYDRLAGIQGNEAGAVRTVMTNDQNGFFNADGGPTTGYTLSWKSDPNFPGCHNLPDGAVALKYENGKFQYASTSVEGMNITEVSKYMKPARLAYFVNTVAMTRNTPYFDSNNNPADWGTAVNAYSQAAVSLNTQSVILKDQIQYAVGRLDVQVRVSENTLYDSGSGVEGAADKEPQMVIAPNRGYQLTGVLIGGQKRVNWKFEPNGDTDYTIYDKEMTRDIYAKVGPNYNSEEVNHTLTLETHEGEATRICLEFVNNGKDFFGYGNKIIPSGSKFYLVATLKPGEKVIDNPNNKNQVFLQDYITTAKLTIGENSLKNAYNVVPDLRSPKLELGLSVDLKWEKGITFEQEF